MAAAIQPKGQWNSWKTFNETFGTSCRPSLYQQQPLWHGTREREREQRRGELGNCPHDRERERDRDRERDRKVGLSFAPPFRRLLLPPPSGLNSALSRQSCGMPKNQTNVAQVARIRFKQTKEKSCRNLPECFGACSCHSPIPLSIGFPEITSAHAPRSSCILLLPSLSSK